MSRTDAPPGTSKTPGSGQTSAHLQTKRTSEMRGTSSRVRCWQAATATTTEMTTTIAANRHDTLETPPRRPRDSPHAARGARDGHGQEDGAQHRDASRTGGGRDRRDTRRDRSRDMAQPLMSGVPREHRFSPAPGGGSVDVFHAPATKLSYEGRRSGGVILLVRKTVSGFVTRVNVDLDNTLIDMCATGELWLLTGDCDESSGDFTFISPTGNSVVDYFLCNFDLISKCLAQILQRVESPHMPVVLHVTYMLRTEAGIGEKQRIENLTKKPTSKLGVNTKLLVDKKRNHNRSTCTLLLANKNNGGVFWEHVKRAGRKKTEQPKIQIDEWETHFRTALGGEREPRGDRAPPTDDVEKIVDVLNEHSVQRTWSTNDVERVHRVGKDKNKHPRPLIVRFSRWGDKMAVMQDADLQQSLKGMPGCQSSSRPDQMSESRNRRVRKDGKFGYYKNGRLHFADRHSPGDRPTDHDQGPLQDKRRQR
ncbi:hypothetical protein BaRGS_00023976, partial [Batillaria attramentaria]